MRQRLAGWGRVPPRVAVSDTTSTRTTSFGDGLAAKLLERHRACQSSSSSWTMVKAASSPSPTSMTFTPVASRC